MEEFDFNKIKITSEAGKKYRPNSSRARKAEEEYYAKQWFWHSDLFLGKKPATGQMLRLYLVLLRRDFDEFHKPFKVTTETMRAARVNPKAKKSLLRAFEQLGILFVEWPDGKKNPTVLLRSRQGRGENPFHNSG